MGSKNSFPLRLRDEQLREFVRELAKRDSVSQNEFIETAIEHEVIIRGVLVAGELAGAAELIALTEFPRCATLERFT